MILFEFLFFRRGAGSSPKAPNDKTTDFRFGLPAVLICCTMQINYRKGADKEILNGAPELQIRMLKGWIRLEVNIQANRVVQPRCDCNMQLCEEERRFFHALKLAQKHKNLISRLE